MGYQRRYQKKASEELRNVHPIWRGIGFVMMLVIPVVSFAASDLFIQAAPNFVPGWALPRVMMGSVEIPVYGTVQNLGAVLAFSVVIMAGLFAIFFLLNSIVISLMGGDPADKLHAPAEKYQKKRKLK